IQDNLKALKEIQTLHNKHTKRQEELDSTLKRCKDEFKEFERQNVKHREDLKHVKQKIQKMEEKTEKDTTKITENSADLIPKLEEDIPKLKKNSWTRIKFWKAPKVYFSETETFRTPWEKQLIEHQGKLEVASTENKLLSEKECRKDQEELMTFEQAARQKLTKLKSVRVLIYFITYNKLPSKYDVAISTAVGGLDYIVIETSAAAQACMDMLRKNTLGVATFMIMV
ncbi:structural maintenance of chromosomes protein 4, partial [Tanacetum coccineum]